MVYKFISAFSILVCGVLVAATGWLALIWYPLGAIGSLFVFSNVLLPLLVGIPFALRFDKAQLAMSGLLATVVFRGLFAIAFWAAAFWGVFFTWPKLLADLLNNTALLAGIFVGFFVILISPLSAKVRADFMEDFLRNFKRKLVPSVPRGEFFRAANLSIGD